MSHAQELITAIQTCDPESLRAVLRQLSQLSDQEVMHMTENNRLWARKNYVNDRLPGDLDITALHLAAKAYAVHANDPTLGPVFNEMVADLLKAGAMPWVELASKQVKVRVAGVEMIKKSGGMTVLEVCEGRAPPALTAWIAANSNDNINVKGFSEQKHETTIRNKQAAVAKWRESRGQSVGKESRPILRSILCALFVCLPVFASASQMPSDLSLDRASSGPEISVSSADLLGVGAVVWPHTLDAIADLFTEQPSDSAAQAMVALDSKLDLGVAKRAMDAMFCAQDKGMVVDKVIVVDMSAKATEKRLWAFDIKDPSKPRLVINERVAHGSGSDRDGDGVADKFSNTPNSHMTSLGLYAIAEKYQGKNGWSRRLDGLLSYFNGKARERAVVMHPSNYVSKDRVGRSQGCPAVSQATMDALEKSGMNNAVLWIDGPDKKLEKEVASCAEKRKAKALAITAKQRDDKFAALLKQIQSPDYSAALTIDMSRTEMNMGLRVTPGPTPEPEDGVMGCDFTVPRSVRQAMPECLGPIDTMGFPHRII